MNLQNAGRGAISCARRRNLAPLVIARVGAEGINIETRIRCQRECKKVDGYSAELPYGKLRSKRGRDFDHGNTIHPTLGFYVGEFQFDLLAQPSYRHPDSGLPRAAVYDLARLRPRRLLPQPASERLGGARAWCDNPHPLRSLAGKPCRSPCHVRELEHRGMGISIH